MIEVELPDGTIAEFPDGTKPEVIKTTLQKQLVKTTAKERVSQMGPFRKALYGAERSLDESAMGLKQIAPEFLGGGLSPKEREELAIRREMEDQIPGSGVSRFVGDAVQWASPSRLAFGAAAKLPALAGTVGKLATAAGVGAASGGLQPVLEGESRGANAALGGALGAAGQGVGDAVGRGIEGLVKRSSAAHAMPEAVKRQMTLGQSADRGTLSGRIIGGLEERVQSIPVVGDFVRSARERGSDAFRKSVIDSVAPDGYTPKGGAVRGQIDDIQKEFTSRYAKVLAGKQVDPSRLFESSVARITNNPQSGVPRQQAQSIADDIMRNYQSRFRGVQRPGGGSAVATGPQGAAIKMDATNAKDFESFLLKEAKDLDLAAQKGTPGARNLAKIYSDLADAWKTSYYRQVGTTTRKALDTLDNQYAPFKTVERAAGARGTSTPGAFTPAQLDEAVATRTGRARYARGQGMLQDKAEAGREVFGARIPDSGSAERAGMGLAALGGMALDPVATGSTLAAIPLLTSGPGKRLMTGETATQRLMKQLRLNQAARASGLPAGIGISDVSVNESERY